MQGNHCEPFACSQSATGINRGVDFAHARHEDEDVTRLARVNDSADRISSLFRDRPFIMMIEIRNLNRITLAFGYQDWAISQISGDGLGLECCRHDRDL